MRYFEKYINNMDRYKIILLIVAYLLSSSSGRSQEPKLILPIGHSLGVSAAVFSPDGKNIITTSLDNSAKIWEVETGRLLANLRGYTDTIVTANYSPDGKKIVTSCEDGTAKIWDANTALPLADLKGHTGPVYTVEFSPDGKKIVSTSEDGLAKIWDAETGKLLVDLRGHTKAIWPALFSRDGKKIVTGSNDSTAKVWDVATGKVLADLRGHTFEVWSAEFSPDGKKIITGSGDSTAKIWDAESGKLLMNIRDHHAEVRIVHFSPDGKRFISASDDGDVKLWNTETYSLIANIKGKPVFNVKTQSHYPDIVRAADFSPDGKKILTVYRDSATNIWDAYTGKFLLHIKRGNEYVNYALFSKDGKKFSLALAYAHAEIYDVSKGTLLTDLKGEANYLSSFDYSPDGRRILITADKGSAKLLDAATGTLVANFPSNKDDELGVFASFSPDGKKIVVIDRDNTVKVYEALTGTLLMDLKGHKSMVMYAWFSQDGKKIFSESQDSTVKIWDATEGKLLADISKGNSYGIFRNSEDGKKMMIYSPDDSITKIFDSENGRLIVELNGYANQFMNPEFSPDGKKIVNGSYNDTAQIWNSESGAFLYKITEPGYRIRTTTFTPDGKKLIIISADKQTKIGKAKIYDAESGSFITELKQEGSSFRWNVLFSPDGKKILAPMEDGTIKIWDAATGNFLNDLIGIKGTAYAFSLLSFSPDGKKFGTGSNDGTAIIWDIETGKVLMELKEHTFTSWVQFSRDGKKIITLSQDHTAKVWDSETWKSLYTYISVNKDDYLITDKDNHYDGSEAARKLLYFTCGTEVIELEQVKDQLWIPNLAERILNGETINAQKLSDLNICNLTPLVDTLEQSSSHYRFRVTPRLGGLGATIVYVNGIEVKRYMPQQLTQQKSEYQLAIDKKELQKFFVPHAENNITVKAMTAKTSISSRSVSFKERGKEKIDALPNLYAIIVGVSDYKGDELDLKFASKDAVDMANAMDASAKKLLNTDGKEHVFIYKIHTGTGRDRFPEKNSIHQVFTEIGAKAQANDILLVFFAGHGVMEAEKNRFYFLTADASNATVSGALKDVGISTEELSDWIKPQVLKAQKRILIFDACNSGQVIKELISMGQKGQNLLASRGDEKEKQIKAIEKLNERSGMFILSASASDQKAYEMGKYNQGTLTYSLLKAIKDQPDILEERKYLNISRWFNAAEKSVGELARETGARQQPQLVSTTNFNVGIVDEEVRDRIVLPFEKPMLTRSEFRNVDLRIDNLKLRNLVDKQLDEISGNSSGSVIMYSPEFEGANIYAISGDYTVSGSDVSVSVILTKGGTEIKTKFESKGSVAELTKLAESITGKVTDWFELIIKN